MTVNFGGNVYDDAGNAVSGASVKLLETGTTTQEGSTVTTDSNGRWDFLEADQDRYDVEITKGSSVRRIKWSDEISLQELDVRNNTGAAYPAATFTNLTNSAANQVAVFSGANSTKADNDEIYLSFKLADSAGNLDEFARMTVVATDVTSGTEDGQIEFDVIKAGTLTNVWTLTSSSGAAMSFDMNVDSLTFGAGADTDITLTFDANSADGVITWMEDEDYFKFSDDILMNSTERINLGDTGTYIYQSADGQLDIISDTELGITAPTVDIDASTEVNISTDLKVGDDLSLTSDSSVFNMGAGNDFTITHDGTTGATLAGNPITITSAAASTWSTSSGALTITSGAALNLNPTSGSAILLDGTISVDAGVVTGATSITSTAFVGDITGDVTGTADTATVATTVTITDNESTDEDNAIIFTAGGDVDGGNIGLESDGTLTYNPSTGKVTATGFVGTLTGNVTGNTSGSAATVTTASQTAITTLANLVTTGTIGTGVWQGTAIAGAYINDDIVSGQAEITSGLAAADELLYSDAGTVKRVGVDTLTTYLAGVNAGTVTATGLSDSSGVLTLDIQNMTASTTIADADLIVIDDGAGGTLRKMTRAHFIESAALDEIDIDGGAIDGAIIGANSAAAITGTTIDAGTDFTIDDTVITNGVITDSTGLQIAAAVDLANNTLSNVGAAGNDWGANSLALSSSYSGARQTINIENSNTAASSAAAVQIVTAASANANVDPYVHFRISGTESWSAGIDNDQSDRFVIGNSESSFADSTDAIRITAASPPVVSFNTSQGSDFDYVCAECGRHEFEVFTCCGKVEWHDDVSDFRAMSQRSPDALDYMEKVGVIQQRVDDSGKRWVFTTVDMMYFVGSMAFQNRQRMDVQYGELDRRLAAIGG